MIIIVFQPSHGLIIVSKCMSIARLMHFLLGLRRQLRLLSPISLVRLRQETNRID